MDAVTSPPRLVRFEAFEFDRHTLELRKHGLKIKLSGQPMEVLALLLARPGELVAREELQHRLWPHDTIVEFEHSINAAVKTLRRALDDSADEPRYIETLARRGYRFIAPVEVIASPQAAAPVIEPVNPEVLAASESPSLETPSEAGAEETSADLAGQTVSHYRVLDRIGSGAMGVIYRAEDTRLGRMVALKFLPSELAPDRQALARFQREARAASALNHPNICTVHDIDEHAGRPFIAMELLEGETLKEMLAVASISDRRIGGPRPPLQLDTLLDLANQIAAGLQAAHAKGIIHRDIKPANIFLTTQGQAKILDFGVAKLTVAAVSDRREVDGAHRGPLQQTEARTEDTLTQPGSPIGTAAYMSPEQVRGEALDTRTDIFSFGAVLYELATGRQAFPGGTSSQVQQAILTQQPVSPKSLYPDLPSKLAEIINKALEKDREVRYQQASDMRVDLQRLKRDIGSPRAVAPVGARPDLTGDRRPQETARRGAPQWRWAVIALSIFVLVAAVLVVVLNVASLRDAILTAVGARRAAPLPKIDSLAVLPLENLSGDPQQEYFADGMTEALIAELGQIGSLRVISRTSVMQYKGAKKPLPQIARELNVDAVIEGSVFRVGDRVRITAQLIGVAPERHLWARNYERDLRDVLSLQGEIARTIADEVKANVTPDVQARLASARPVNPEAHEAYLKGQFFMSKFTEEGYQKATEYAQQAVQIDPDYAPAYGLLAFSYWCNSRNAFGHLPDLEAAGKAKVAAMKALAIDDTLAEPHVALGAVLTFHDWNWAGAEREIKRAIELNPNLSLAHGTYAWCLVCMGRQDESIREAKRENELDPTALLTLTAMYYYGRQYDQALEHARKWLEMFPDNFAVYGWLTLVLQANGMYDQEVAAWQKALTLSGEKPEDVAALGRAYKVGGIRGAWRWDIERLKESTARNEFAPTDLAARYASLGEKDKALDWLEKAYEKHIDGMVEIKVDPDYDCLRSDPRFQDLVRRMRFPN
jgi:serine/threonine protein kinase/TolB-like protein/DNA-binding winged helix-turn-helix (wHTH) protein